MVICPLPIGIGGVVAAMVKRHDAPLGWVGGGSPGNEAERPTRIPRSISSLGARLPGGAVSRQPQLRAPNGFGSVPLGFGSALAGAAPTTQEPTAIAALTSIFVITWWC